MALVDRRDEAYGEWRHLKEAMANAGDAAERESLAVQIDNTLQKIDELDRLIERHKFEGSRGR